MSDIIKDGGAAFPSAYPAPTSTAQLGMSLRDWFAGMIASGIITKGARAGVKEIASDAYDIADAMIAERSRTDDDRHSENDE